MLAIIVREVETLMFDECKGSMAVEGRMATAGGGRGEDDNDDTKEEMRRARRRKMRRRHSNQIQMVAVENSGNAGSSNPGRICLQKAFECAQTLCICLIWMWEAVYGGCQPQP